MLFGICFLELIMRYYIIAGEASGDLHAANLMYALKEKDAEASFRVWGGDLMQAAGGELVRHYRDLAFMGFMEVAKNIRTILRNLKFCKQDIANYQPDVLILVDYPGFNLRIAAWAKQQNIHVFYYISPQIWAWKEGRVEKIRRDVARMFVILPFEKDFYKKHDIEVDFVGHPLLDVVLRPYPQPLKGSLSASQSKVGGYSPLVPIAIGRVKRIALLPGSRQQEIRRMLTLMLEVVPKFPDCEFVVAGAPSISADFYASFLKNTQVKLIENKTYEVLESADAALVTSGTATLEAALFDVPQVVCYRGNKWSYQIAKRLVKVNYISLVNLISEKEVVKELIQDELTVDNLTAELKVILTAKKRHDILNDYVNLREKLGGAGASKRAAELMVEYLKC